MNEKAIRKDLEARRREVERALGVVDRTTVPDGVGDLVDAQVQSEARELAFADRTRLQRDLRLIEDAMGRLADGSYGTCVDCGGKISPRRLQAMPYAATCIGCQQQREREPREDDDVGIRRTRRPTKPIEEIEA